MQVNQSKFPAAGVWPAGDRAAADAAPAALAQDWRKWLMLAVAVLLLSRLALMLWAPLADTTEARYGELARQTASNAYWLMPHMDAHTPFFAKPPLSTWTSAVSMRLFGVNEFAARLPSLLVSLPALWIAACFAGALGVRARWLVVPVLASSPLFFISAGAVMTDAVQMTVVWAAQYMAWRAWHAGEGAGDINARRWRLGFWALVGLGALSKGLATWVLIMLPLAAYALLERRPLQLARQLLDWRGMLLAAAIFLPWYGAAEYYYPGFINYFIVGEHFSRFLVPGWTGDRYGTAHRQPLGAIWLFWVGAMLPWIHVFVGGLLAMRRRGPASASAAALPPLARFLWCATLAPLLFFTFSRNIIWTYALTAVPPFAVLAAHWLENSAPRTQRRTGLALAAYALLALAVSPFIVKEVSVNSERALVQAFEKAAPPGAKLQYLTRPAFSSAFYTRGTLRHEEGAAGLLPSQPGQAAYVVMDNEDVRRLAIPAADILYAGHKRSLVELK